MTEPVWKLAVAPGEGDLLLIMLCDIAGGKMRGPDGGEDGTGYTADELRPILRERYQLAATDIDALIMTAMNKRPSAPPAPGAG